MEDSVDPDETAHNIHCCKQGFQSKINYRMAKTVDPGKMSHYEPSHLDLHCLQRYLHWSAGMKGIRQ